MSQPPLTGHLLVAAPELLDPNFAQSVVLVGRHVPENGAIGWILNRPTHLTLGEALAGNEEVPARNEVLWLGGPVETSRLWLLFRGRLPGAERAQEQISFTPAAHLIRQVLVGEGPDPVAERFRPCMGYAGWEAGQLEGELSEGAWVVVPAGPEAVFTPGPRRMWQQMLQRAMLMRGEGLDLIERSRWN